MVVAYLFVFLVAASWVFLWVRHFYLVYKLNVFLMKYHQEDWESFKRQNPNWLEMEPWPSSLIFTCYSRAPYNFIWRSRESYGDQSIVVQRQRIRRFVWELPLWFVAVVAVIVLLILTGVLR
jgi:hypothetical protein